MENTVGSSRQADRETARGRGREAFDFVARRLGTAVARAFVTEVIHGGDRHLARLL